MTTSETTTDKESSLIHVNEMLNEIHFNSIIGQTSMTKLITELLNLEGKILKKEKKLRKKLEELDEDEYTSIHYEIQPKPIKLYITSAGGSLFQAFSAMDTISNMTIPVHTICKGYVASAGTLLALMGKKRFMTFNSFMLIHELRSGTWGKFSNMVESVENSKLLMEHIKEIYIEKTKLTREELEIQLKKDELWDAKTCLEFGLVDEIIKR